MRASKAKIVSNYGEDKTADQNHKTSRAIVNAAANGVKTIKLEELSGVCQLARTSCKNNHSLHSWSFYRLAKFIEYKSALVGVTHIEIDSAQ